MDSTSHRYCVIMCGGVGSRFWPYSREERPKQFIDFLGTGRTLLQMSFDRIRAVVPAENVIILTNSRYTDLVREQLPELESHQILAEPPQHGALHSMGRVAHRRARPRGVDDRHAQRPRHHTRSRV